MRTHGPLLWVREGNGILRLWTTRRADPSGAGGGQLHELHFAGPDWSEIGSVAIDPELRLEDIDQAQLQRLLELATGAGRAAGEGPPPGDG